MALQLGDIGFVNEVNETCVLVWGCRVGRVALNPTPITNTVTSPYAM